MPALSMWDKSLDATLDRLYHEGHGFSAIAKIMGHGLTRNAISGRIYRRIDNGALKPRADYKISGACVSAQPRPPNAPKPPPVRPVERAPEPEAPGPAAGPPLDDLPFHGACKWPITPFHATQHLFCAAVISAEHTYCAAHRALAYEPPTSRVRYYPSLDGQIVRKAS